MRFLTDDELPEPERERRKVIRAHIDFCQKSIADEWKHADPTLTRMVMEGEYAREQHYRGEIIRRTEILRREIASLNERLPPYMEMRKDHFLEMIIQQETLRT